LKVVCDASTLIALARIGQLEILERTGAQVVIPRAVYEEVIVQGEGKPGATEVSKAAWIETREVTDHSIVARFRMVLDAGESEAIALAQEVDADLLILDDEEARDTALLEGLSVVGLLAFLVRAKAWGIVREVRPLLDALKRQGFFISDELYQHVLRMAGEL
jgi:predicted nucleic acid-binding protein